MALRAYNFPRQPPPVGGEQPSPLSGWFDLIAQRFRTMENLQNHAANATPSEEVFWNRVDASGGARTITLPSAVTRDGKKYGIVKFDSTANAVTVAFDGSETANGASTIILRGIYDALVVVSNGTNWDIITLACRPRVTTFTRDTATASGNQAVTGIGFPPRGVAFFALRNAGSRASWGLDDLTTAASLSDNHNNAASTWAFSGTSSIVLDSGAGDVYTGKLASLDVAGYTIAWTRTGVPTGSVDIMSMSFP